MLPESRRYRACMRRIVSSQVASASRLHPTMLRKFFRWHISSCSSCRAVSANVESPNSAVGVTTALKSFNLPLIDRCLFTNMNQLIIPSPAATRCFLFVFLWRLFASAAVTVQSAGPLRRPGRRLSPAAPSAGTCTAARRSNRLADGGVLKLHPGQPRFLGRKTAPWH